MNGFLAHLVMRALESPATVRPIVAKPFETVVPAAPQEDASLQWPARARGEVSLAQAATTVSQAVASARPIVENEGSNALPAPTSRQDSVRAPNTRTAAQTGARDEQASDAVTPSERRSARDVARASISESVCKPADDIGRSFVGLSYDQGAPQSDSFVHVPKSDAAPSRATATVSARSAQAVDTAAPPPSRQMSSVRANESVTRLDTRPAKSASMEAAAPRLQPILPPALRPTQPSHAPGASGSAAPQEHGEGPRPVQVTIGRVEIRAVTPAARPQSPARVQRKPALSLSDYLNRESGARR